MIIYLILLLSTLLQIILLLCTPLPQWVLDPIALHPSSNVLDPSALHPLFPNVLDPIALHPSSNVLDLRPITVHPSSLMCLILLLCTPLPQCA